MKATKMLTYLAVICVFVTTTVVGREFIYNTEKDILKVATPVARQKFSCNREKDILKKHLITTDPSNDVSGEFIVYWNLRWKTTQKKNKVICPFIEFTHSDKGEFKEQILIKTLEGKLDVELENQFTKTDHPGIFDVSGVVTPKLSPTGTSYNGNFMYFHFDGSVLGYVICSFHNQEKRVIFEVLLKRNKLEEAEAKTDNGAPNDIQKSLDAAKQKMIEIVKDYKTHTEDSSAKSGLNTEDEISVEDQVKKTSLECYNIKDGTNQL